MAINGLKRAIVRVSPMSYAPTEQRHVEQAPSDGMTALHEYQRLESTGLWRPTRDAQRRDVFVSVGEATLIMTDQANNALAHWSLAALVRRNPGQTPAIFAPGEDAIETLELDDAEMIAAIEKVRRAVERARPRPGKLRSRITLASIALGCLIAVTWLPDVVIRHSARIAPAAARGDIGTALLAQIEEITGTPCRTPAGEKALVRLKARLIGPGAGQIVILRGGGPTSLHLPGRLILLDRSVVEDHETPEVAAGYVLAENARAAEVDPLLRLLDRAGLRTALGLLTKGRIDEATLRAYAEYVLTTKSPAISNESVIDAFARAGVRSSPYAYALDISGEATLSLIEADPIQPEEVSPVLADGDWVALQGICGG